MAKVNGYALREAIKQWTLKRDTAAAQFNGSLKAFPDEDKESPVDVADAFAQAEIAIASLQTAQMRYNIAVMHDLDGQEKSLAIMIKSVGGIARLEKMWRSAATPKEDRYGRADSVREAGQVHAASTINSKVALARAVHYGKLASKLRKTIAIANSTEFEIEDLDASLLE